LADKLGVSNKTVSKWENGGGLPDTNMLPTLAQTLGVTVDDIVSDDALPAKRVIHARRTIALSRSRKTKLLALTLSVAVLLIFIVSSVFWRHYMNTVVAPFLENDRLKAMNIGGSRSTTYRYDSQENNYIIEVVVPPHLSYRTTTHILAQGTGERNFYGDFWVFHGDIFTGYQRTYVLSLGEGIVTTKTDEAGKVTTAGHTHSFSSAVDVNGKPLGRHPDDSEEFYEEWLRLYEKYYDEIMAMILYFKDFFGEDLF
jgi:transcriptional regulator with XRE-family HTH domain